MAAVSPIRLISTRCSLRCLIGTLVLLTFSTRVFATYDEDRISQLNGEIQSIQKVSAGTKDASERARLEAKLSRLQQEIGIIQERQEIAVRERTLSDDLNTNPLDALREKLRGVDQTMEEADARIHDLLNRRIQVVHDRDDLQRQLDVEKSRKEPDGVKVADLEERLFTRSEELSALALQREAAEDSSELAHEADRIREELKSVDPHRRPSVRAMFESYTQQRDQQKVLDRLTNLLVSLEHKLAVNQKALELAQQEVSKFDEELAVLEKQRGFFSSDSRVDRFMAAQRTQKKAALERVPFIAEQVDAIKQAERTIKLREDLLEGENTFQKDQYKTLKTGYQTRLRFPAIGLVVVALLFLVSRLLLLRLFFKNEELFLAYRLARYVSVVAAVGLVAAFLFDDLSMVAATLGVVSAALVISLQDVCTSMFGWFVIILGAKFAIGDRLEIDSSRGDVIDIQLLRTTLLEINGWLGIDQPTGRVIVVPNNFIFRSKVFNFSHGHPFIWGKIDITITYSTKVAAAMALFQEVLEEETREEFAAAQKASSIIRKRYGVDDAVYVPKIYTHIADSGVTFSLFFVADYHAFSATRNRLNRRLIDRLEERDDIQLAYNTLQLRHENATPVLSTKVTERSLSTPPLSKVTTTTSDVAAVG